MTALASEVRVRPVFVRSVHLERDTPQPPLDGYVPTARALATLERLASAMTVPASGRAWSITGPYGSGKSHFAAFLDALCGPPERDRARAEALLAAADPVLHERFRAARKAFGAEHGLVRAVATAQREPVAATLVRALRTGAGRRWGKKLPRGLGGALLAAERGAPRARELAALVARMAAETPVLLVVDEFGKNLEYLAEDAAGGDLFVLQEIAELAAGANVPVLFLTLQHLAFTDYAVSADLGVARRREWAKVQGRFEDVAFVDSSAQAARIIASTLDQGGASRAFVRRVRAWAAAGFEDLASIGLVPSPVQSPDALARCYPLHPLTTVALPELCARFGQHERTLIGFLASTEPGTVASFLADTELPRQGLPAVGLDAAYDYFVGAAATMISSAPDAGRWLEIEARLRDVQGVGAEDLQLLKTIAVLNLVSAGGSLRASASVLAVALGERAEALGGRLAELERRGLVTYREFAGEYRIWQGSDFDIRGHLEEARARMKQRPVAELLAEVVPPAPVVAARHSQRVGMLRFFEAAYLAPDGPFDVPPGADGLLAYVVGAGASSGATLVGTDPRPVVVATIDEPAGLTAAVVEAAAHLEVLHSTETLTGDWVARRELQERVVLAVEAVRARLAEVFAPGGAGVHWRSVGGSELAPGGAVSRLLSAVCDEVYRLSPEIHSEMLGRRELTSQGAKARRELLVAMVERGTQEQLGIEGYGPERAMYEAVLRHPGIHRYDKAEATWVFSPPRARSSLGPVWRALDDAVVGAFAEAVGVDRLYSLLVAPPFGIKEGLIPVLVAAVLLYRHDEVAIYQDGTYQPQLTADVLERLVKVPDRFALKSFEATGTRRALLDALGASLGVVTLGRRRRNPSVVRVAAPLLSALRSLPDYTLHTSSLSNNTVAVRAALLGAREPDELLFSSLPEACGVAPYAAGARSVPGDLDVFVERLVAALEELRSAYPRLIVGSAEVLAEALSLPVEMSELRADLRARARRLEGQVLDPRLRAFLFIAVDSQLDDEQWLEAVLLNVSQMPARSWRDDDARRFESGLVTLAGLFRRVESLHFETLARQGRGFDARQVTITAPDGKETTSVFWVDREVHPHIATVADEAAGRAREIAGSEGLSALIAVLADMVSRSEQTEGVRVEIVEEEAKAHG